MIVEVALNLPLQKTFDYAWPEGLDVDPVPGLRVLVPFARRKMGGVITALKKHSDFSPLKKVEKTIEEDPSMTGEILELCRDDPSHEVGHCGGLGGGRSRGTDVLPLLAGQRR